MSAARSSDETRGRRRRVLIAIGTRPEAIKLAPVVRELRATDWADVRVLATAQHRELLDGVLEFFGIRPDVDLDAMRPGQSLAELTGRMLPAVDAVLAEQRPDLVLAQGDTTTVLVTALACFYRSTPMGHVEAGLRSGNMNAPFPEEMNRVAVGRLATLHFAPTERARANLIAEGIAADRVHVTGNTAIDALLWTADRELPDVAVDPARPTILMTAHRRESFGAPLAAVCDAVLDIVAARDVQVLYPVHPNPNVGRVARDKLGDHPRIALTEPLDYPRFVAAMRSCRLILSDSGGVQEEAPSLGKPVLVLREETERVEGIASGCAALVGTDRERIVARTLELLDSADAYDAMASVDNPYGDGKAAARIGAIVRDWTRRAT